MPNPTGVVGTDGIVPVKAAVYQISNMTTEEYYIGATSNFNKRIKQHIYSLKKGNHENVNLQKMALNDVKLEIVIFPVETTEIAFAIEKQLIKDNKHNPKCLNIKDSCPAPMTGRHHSKETKQKISDHHKQMYINGYVNPFQDKQHSKEFVEKHNQFLREHWSDPVLRKQISIRNSERMKDPANREVSRQAALSAWDDENYRIHQLQKRREQFDNPINKEKLSIKQTERMKDPVNRETSRQAAISQWKNPEFRAKRCKQVTINGNNYSSLADALKSENMANSSYYRHLKKGLINNE